ncbi:MAG: signal peptide peptidase SppA [Proteobacteria bacterium]|nr:signal peptide peptidase SppA [Pseudomonadota bacterium]
MSIVKNLLAAFGLVIVVILLISLMLSSGGHGRGDKVAVVKLQGVILDSSEIVENLDKYAKRKDVKAVVLRVDSPGGAVGPSQEIYSAVQRLRKSKTVVASLGSVAASGGYYAAAATEQIVANPGTITGSIGVIIEFINASELLDKVGIKGRVIKSGKFKDTGSPLRDLDAEETALIQSVVDDVNSQFINAVAVGRNKPVEEITAIADGRIMTGSKALSIGLIDKLGDLNDAIELGASLAGIKGIPEVIYPPEKGAAFASLFGSVLSDNLRGYMSGMRIMYLIPTGVR